MSPAPTLERPRSFDVLDRRRSALSYSLATIVAPAVVLFGGLFVLQAVGLDQDYVTKITKSLLDGHDWPPLDDAQSAVADLNGRLRFAGAHTVLLACAYGAIATAFAIVAPSIHSHGGVDLRLGALLAFVLALTAGVGAIWRFAGIDWLPGIKIRDFFIYLVPEMLSRSGFKFAPDLITQIERHGAYGGTLGFAAASALVGAAAALAYRWQTPEWRSPERLRRQMQGLIALLIASSVLLVASNAAVRQLLSWPVGILPAAKANAQAESLLDLAKNLSGALSYWWSVMSTLVLIACFGPVSLSLATDIDTAARAALQGRTNGQPDAEITPTMLAEWKKERGLLFSATQATGIMIASAAPLLTAPVLDVAKTIVSPG